MAYFVESIPTSCFFCDCCHERSYDLRYKICGEKFCGIENMEVGDHYDHNKYDNVGRPKWCPLRELPNHMVRFGEEDDYTEGYNDCLDEILSK